jgi:mRNA interferase MazF
MAITIHPKIGQILLCDFSQGFKAPEMVKSKRPVIIVSGALKERAQLVTVVPLSTVKPNPVQPYHYLLPQKSMPMLSHFQQHESWVKGDMLYTVAFHRLDLIKLGTRNLQGKREYYLRRLGREQMRKIYECILNGLSLSRITQHL